MDLSQKTPLSSSSFTWISVKNLGYPLDALGSLVGWERSRAAPGAMEIQKLQIFLNYQQFPAQIQSRAPHQQKIKLINSIPAQPSTDPKHSPTAAKIKLIYSSFLFPTLNSDL